MKCPHCGASNYNLKRRPSKSKSIRRGYAGSCWGNDDYEPVVPNVIVHPQCQPHVSGDLFSPEGMTCHCDGCKSFFNCWTGNVDDGEYNVPLEKSREERVKEAKIIVQKKDDVLEALNGLRARMGKVGFGYQFQKETWYAKYGGTIWKLTPQDIEAILKSTWDSEQTQVIHRTFSKRGVNPNLAKLLLNSELLVQRRA